ncbi:MmcQ/YjbR family DNA-binding protein [Lacticaseibacillus hulanensis]|uniref:MmcQ/YjbR family DNA-binding protein n=1 Tax=Lacticaseibacillus hulanensis TaxID=2493111 RepID=UPI000FD9ECCF|nr:MmcQ/YjbR family DNA-binding protein [Lacticaseibacillus hulanensis]
MTTIQDEIFKHLLPNAKKLADFGFINTDGAWHYKAELAPGFELTVTIKGDTITSPVIDTDSGHPYVLHLDPANSGLFVGQIRGAYIAVLTAIAKDCCDPTMFTTGQMEAVIAAVADEFDEHPEFLWAKFPNNAIIRRADNRKWYALLVKVTEDKVGLPDKDPVDVLVVRADPATIADQLHSGAALPAYHMNKQHWLSYRLNNGTDLKWLMARVGESRELAK